ncbi:MAG TPA: AAA family ATPase [Candidatus Saccharimonadales bacterium]|nr:AAA family ATPase [Candidatus Saccharimonadales bacterium]
MEKLSPHYRNDNADDLPADIKAYLDKHFLQQLENLQVQNPKLLVVFSAANGVGKSSLAQRLKRDLKALVLENDQVKTCLLAYNPDLGRDELNRLTWQYTMNLYARLPAVTPNGLVVRDGVIDWYYDRILPVFGKQGYPIFTVAFDVSEEKRIELLTKRGDKQTVGVPRLMKLFEDHAVHINRFRASHALDAVLTDDNLFDYDGVVAAIRRRLQELQ